MKNKILLIITVVLSCINFYYKGSTKESTSFLNPKVVNIKDKDDLYRIEIFNYYNDYEMLS